MKRIFSVMSIVILGKMNARTLLVVRGVVSNTWIFNKNLPDNGDLVDYKGTFTRGFGVTAIQYPNETVGVEVGIGVNNISQRTQGDIEISPETVDYVVRNKSKLSRDSRAVQSIVGRSKPLRIRTPADDAKRTE